MNILALDTSTYTGWAHSSAYDAYTTESGMVNCSIRTKATKAAPADHDGMRFWLFRSWMLRILAESKADLIVYEKVVGGPSAGGRAALIQKGLEALVWETAFAVDQIPVWNFAAGTIKKWATGNGTLGVTGKFEMVNAAVKAFDSYPRLQFVSHAYTKAEPWAIDDNQCDALWILDLARAVYKQGDESSDTGTNWLHTIEPEDLTRIAQKLTHLKWSRAKSR